MRIVLLGKPGSGKGTQAKRLVEKFGVITLSTGDVIRAAIKSDSARGKAFKSYTEKGLLVPDEHVIGVVTDALDTQLDDGFILDGFPRTIAQAEALDAYLRKKGSALTACLDIAVENELLLKRAEGRRFCSRCGKNYNLFFAPPQVEGRCDDCLDGVLEQRADDSKETVQARLTEYEAKTREVSDYYGKTGRLSRVDGVGTQEEVFKRILHVLNESRL